MKYEYTAVKFNGPDDEPLWATFKDNRLTKISNVRSQYETPQDDIEKHHLQFLLEMTEYLRGNRDIFTTEVDFGQCSDFQKEVLEFVKQVPYGEVITYRDIAIHLDIKAYQAIGTALKNNPLPFIIPCHRVVNSNGGIGEFNLGKRAKVELLKLEDAHVQFEML